MGIKESHLCSLTANTDRTISKKVFGSKSNDISGTSRQIIDQIYRFF